MDRITTYQEFEEPILLKRGFDGRIYKISEDKVAKIYHLGKGKFAGYESQIAEKLHNDGIPTPKPYGVHNVMINDFGNRLQETAYVMEYIQGSNGFSLTEDLMAPLNEDFLFLLGREIPEKSEFYERINKASRKLIKILEKAKRMNYTPSTDADFLGNFIVKENEDLVLIDFANWTHPDIPRIGGDK